MSWLGLTLAAIPSVIGAGHAIAPFIISVLVLALATGLIKPCIAPIIGDQSPVKVQSIMTLKTGEKVIVDPGTTIQSMLMIYYWAVNVGAFMQVATSYAEKRIGFWLAYLVPGIVYIIMPIAVSTSSFVLRIRVKGVTADIRTLVGDCVQEVDQATAARICRP